LYEIVVHDPERFVDSRQPSVAEQLDQAISQAAHPDTPLHWLGRCATLAMGDLERHHLKGETSEAVPRLPVIRKVLAGYILGTVVPRVTQGDASLVDLKVLTHELEHPKFSLVGRVDLPTAGSVQLSIEQALIGYAAHRTGRQMQKRREYLAVAEAVMWEQALRRQGESPRLSDVRDRLSINVERAKRVLSQATVFDGQYVPEVVIRAKKSAGSVWTAYRTSTR
jgi:hypothetical protein